jgi:hypothetical protein
VALLAEQVVTVEGRGSIDEVDADAIKLDDIEKIEVDAGRLDVCDTMTLEVVCAIELVVETGAGVVVIGVVCGDCVVVS